ncbi:MAG: hypothetical protein HYS87_00125 [Candidatus Colwellbacteria bacterium]|nr:hypothetical protein [Candidatus Colwellbacteria bacterium]
MLKTETLLKQPDRKAKTGECVFCGGTVVVSETSSTEPYPTQFNPVGTMQVITEEIHCTRCGLKYAFMPPTDVRAKSISV